MFTIAKYFGEIKVTDPDTKNEVTLELYKHEHGGILGIDSSYIDQVLDDDSNVICISDPFSTLDKPIVLQLENDELFNSNTD